MARLSKAVLVTTAIIAVGGVAASPLDAPDHIVRRNRAVEAGLAQLFGGERDAEGIHRFTKLMAAHGAKVSVDRYEKCPSHITRYQAVQPDAWGFIAVAMVYGGRLYSVSGLSPIDARFGSRSWVPPWLPTSAHMACSPNSTPTGRRATSPLLSHWTLERSGGSYSA